MPTPLSCCIIAKNEGDRIGATIASVIELADEVVVVDSGSTDDTVAVAETAGARVIFNAWPGYGPQKRFSEDAARHDWILHLDADEVVTPALRDEIKALMATGPKLKGYRFRINDIYPRRSKPRLWGDMYNLVRLYDRRAMRFSESLVHDRVVTGDHQIGQLRGAVHHFSMRSWAHLRQKLNAYVEYQSKVMKKPLWVICARLPFEYPLVFIRYYLLRRHFTGGLDGIYSSHLAAEARFNRLLKMLQVRASAGGATTQ